VEVPRSQKNLALRKQSKCRGNKVRNEGVVRAEHVVLRRRMKAHRIWNPHRDCRVDAPVSAVRPQMGRRHYFDFAKAASMKQPSYLMGGIGIALAAGALAFVSYDVSGAHPADFQARWGQFITTGKQDRLAPPRPNRDTVLFSFSDMKAQKSMLQKITPAPVRAEGISTLPAIKPPAATVPHSPVREIEDERKAKLPVGCESIFSPVVVPAMAHISGRCIAGSLPRVARAD
jgi:hypothetical protein